MSTPGKLSVSRNCLMARWSTQLLANPPKKKLAKGSLRLPPSADPAEPRNQSDEWSSGSSTPLEASRFQRGNSVPLTSLPRSRRSHVVPTSSSTAPRERRSDAYASDPENDWSLSKLARTPWYSGSVARSPYACASSVYVRLRGVSKMRLPWWARPTDQPRRLSLVGPKKS